MEPVLQYIKQMVPAVYLNLPRGGYSSLMLNVMFVLINTVDSIKNKYTVKEYFDACKGRYIQDIIGSPSTKAGPFRTS